MFSDKRALVWDSGGGGVEHAVRLAKDFGQVWYTTPWQQAGPTLDTMSVGKGLEGIERVDQFWKYVEQADLIYFVESGMGDAAQFLRERGHRVFGAGLGEELEQDRYKMRKIQASLGLPTQKSARVVGTSKLQEYLAKHPKSVVKLNIVRGDMESFVADKLFHVDQQIHKMKFDFGPFKDEFEFLVEEVIDGPEIGFDGFFNGREFLLPTLWGLEHEYSYLGRYDWEIPLPLKPVMLKLQDLLGEYNYRGAISVEVRFASPSKGYLIDMTCRYPYPLSMIYTESLHNYSEVVWCVAGGEDVTPQPIARYAGMCQMLTHYTEKAWTHLEVKDRKFIKLERAAKVNGEYYAVRGEDNGFTLLGFGPSIEAVVRQIHENVDECDCFGLEKDTIGQIDKCAETVEELKKIGVDL